MQNPGGPSWGQPAQPYGQPGQYPGYEASAQPGGYPAHPQQAPNAYGYGQDPKQWGQPGGYAPQQQYGAVYGAQQPYTPAAAQPAAVAVQPMDVESGMAEAMSFAETRVRNGFVRKVFGIVAIQLAVTVGFACACIYVPEIRLYVTRNSWPFWTAWGLALALIIVISCVEKARRTFPLNMILLATFTVVEAFLVGMISARYSIEVVMLAFLVTGAAVVALTLFAANTKIDATRWGNMLWVALVIVLVLMLVGFFWISYWLYLVIAGVAALIFAAYLVYDIQLIMGGKKYQISPDEYVFAALNVYLDIINLFLMILSIIGLTSNNN